MKIHVQHAFVKSTHAIDSMVEERILALQPLLDIDDARVRLEWRREASPAFRVSIHLVTPGPDIKVEAEDHTLAAAIDKAAGALEKRAAEKHQNRLRRIRSNLQISGAGVGRAPRAGR